RAVLDEGSTEAPEPEEAADAREAEPEQEDEDDEPQPAPAEPDPVEPPARLQPPGRGARLDGALRWLEDVEPAPDLEELAPAAAPVADSDPHERRDALLAPVIRDLGRAVKRALADELNLALGAVRESEGLLDVDGALGGILEQRD